MDEIRRIPQTRAQTASRGQVWKTLGVWAVLMGMFAGIYRSIGGDMATAVEVAGGGMAIIAAIVVVLARRSLRELREFNAENSAGVAALARGELESARATFWRWAEQARHPRVAAVAHHNLAWTLARQGQVEHAVDVMVANEDRDLAALQSSGLAPTSAVDLALYSALANRLDDARRWLTVLDSRSNMLAQTTVPAMRAFAQAVIDCRSGNPAEAARSLDERWSEYEAVLTGESARPLRVVRAFARMTSDVRQAGAAEMDLVSVRPAYPREYAILSAAWPEMAAFLAAHELDG